MTFGTVVTLRVRVVCHPTHFDLFTLWYRSQVHVYKEGHEASHIGMVGKVPTSQLLVSNYPVREKQVI